MQWFATILQLLLAQSKRPVPDAANSVDVEMICLERNRLDENEEDRLPLILSSYIDRKRSE